MRKKVILYCVFILCVLINGSLLINYFSQLGRRSFIYSSSISKKTSYGDLQQEIGDLTPIKPASFNLDKQQLEERTEYDPPTNKWFSPGPIGFSVSTGVHLPKEKVGISLLNVPISKQIRFRLTERNQNSDLLHSLEEKVVLSTTSSVEFEYQLPEEENRF